MISSVSPGVIAKVISDNAKEFSLGVWKIGKRGTESHTSDGRK
jgi:hypothetical protein